MSENSAATNRLDVIRSAFWPAIALICLVIFGSPIRNALSNILSATGPAQEIEVGPVKLKLSAQAVRAIKPPPPEIAAALGKLGSNEIEKLLALGPNDSITTCPKEDYMYGGEGDGAIYEGLQRVGFVKILDDSNQGDLGWCRKGKYQLSSLTDNGLRARAYILDVVSKALTITES